MLGDFDLARLVDGPIAAALRSMAVGISTGLGRYLALASALDQIRVLLDAARSWVPGALYRLSLRAARSGSVHEIEIEGTSDLEVRTFLPLEMIERGDRERHAGRLVSPTLCAAFEDGAIPCRSETTIERSGAWSIRVRFELGDTADRDSDGDVARGLERPDDGAADAHREPHRGRA